MIEDYIPHQNLEEPSNIIENSKKEASFILNNNNFKDIKQQIINQNDYINNLKNEIEFSTDEINNIGNNIGTDEENIKLTIYQKLTIASNQLLKAKEQINYLINENQSLKNIISNKDKIISDYEQLVLQSKEKFKKLEIININLKKQLESNKLGNNKNLKENNYNINLNYKTNDNNNNDLNEINKVNDDINDNNNYNYNYNLNYDIKDYQTGQYQDYDKDINYNLQVRNNELIYSLNNIKKELDQIENDYKIKLKEKDCFIEQLSCELINVYKEYVKLSDILEEMNYLVKNSNYNELKTEFNCLLREKEILLKEKEKSNLEIISLREKFMQKPYDCRNINKSENKEYTQLINIFNEKEKNYLNEIDSLKQSLIEKYKEIEELKNRQESIIREYELKIEKLMKNSH